MSMTKEQEEAIERLNRFKNIEILYSNTFAMHIEQLKTVQGDIEIVLSMLQEQQEENKKKDKRIDLMADKLVEAHKWFYSEFDDFTKEDFIRYFERKVEEK